LQAEEAQTILAMKPAVKKFIGKQEPAEQKHPRRHFRSAAAERSLDAMASERLQKILARRGSLAACGRRDICGGARCGEWKRCHGLGTKADPEVDEIFC